MSQTITDQRETKSWLTKTNKVKAIYLKQSSSGEEIQDAVAHPLKVKFIILVFSLPRYSFQI